MNDRCREVRAWLEEGRDLRGAEGAGHLAGCAECRAHAALVESLSGLAVAGSEPAAVNEIMVELPAAGWRIRRWRSWIPSMAGGGCIAAGLAVAGGVPAAQAPVGIVTAVASSAAARVLDLAAVLRGGGDATRILLAAGGAWFVIWLSLTALGGGLAMRALARRSR